MEFYENKSLKRCYRIVSEYGGIDEFFKRIKESINDSYPKEQCYKDILENADFNPYTVQDFIRHIILSDNKEDIDIIVRNLELLENILFDDLILYLNTNDKCKEFLRNEIRKGLIAKQDISKANSFHRFLRSQEDGEQIIEEVFEDFLAAGYDFRLINEILNEMPSLEEKFIKNKIKILQNAQGKNLIPFIKWFNERGALGNDDINLETFVKGLHSDIKDEITLQMLQLIYKELMDKQNLSIRDIEPLGRGSYSNNYKIGQFILKIGETRRTKIIPYHRRILQPIIRQDTSSNRENNLYLEIQNEVDNKWYQDMTEEQIEEELYKIYKEMREEGIIWTDVKKQNVGRLIRPNKTNYYEETLEGDIKNRKTLKINKKELDVNDNSLGIVDRKKEECLQPGELVILDTDYIFKKEDINIKQYLEEKDPERYIRYELRYIHEKEKEKSQR